MAETNDMSGEFPEKARLIGHLTQKLPYENEGREINQVDSEWVYNCIPSLVVSVYSRTTGKDEEALVMLVSSDMKKCFVRYSLHNLLVGKWVSITEVKPQPRFIDETGDATGTSPMSTLTLPPSEKVTAGMLTKFLRSLQGVFGRSR